MADQSGYAITSGLSKRLMNALAGVGVGTFLFAGSFALLYWNEERFDWSWLVHTAPVVSANEPGAGNFAGQLVSVSGTISGSEPIGDGIFFRPGSYVALKRYSEVYAWTEKSDVKTGRSTNGSQTQTTTYEYARQWRERAEDSALFHDPEGHLNPENAIPSREFKASSAAVGAHRIDLYGLELPIDSEIELSAEDFIPARGAALAGTSYIYRGSGSLEKPVTGDIRLKYYGLRDRTEVTVIGKITARGVLESYTHENGKRFYRVFRGSRDDAVAQLKGEYTTLSWVLRALGFAMMWFGLTLFAGPIEVLMDTVPFVGGIARGLAGFVAFPVCLVLTVMTIVISKTLHNPFEVAVCAALVVALVAVLFQKKHVPSAEFEAGLKKAS